LIIWMELSAVIIFLGAAWNAELAESRIRKLQQSHAGAAHAECGLT